ncbi:MAG: hypothetical protein KME15_19430 [Drouetiella hepatica Uher 2000/2452]|jgi:hypothetical protein|uniref:Uncharacterized protein n=1 Tax=Drouetiella hepatica Uher 2000/2452 TaxID=904376 RepID=A0A951QDN4_9CYAN|nr:hypothetical protein [Drouetiella hepatica Uher 2000/2452]
MADCHWLQRLCSFYHLAGVDPKFAEVAARNGGYFGKPIAKKSLKGDRRT